MFVLNSYSHIEKIICNEILDSRGNPTLKTAVVLKNGAVGEASVPSGASVGKFEATERRDGEGGRFHGRGCLKARAAVEGEIQEALRGMSVLDQQGVDLTMITLDCTNNKSNLGANAILSVSVAAAKAGAEYLGVPLYRYLGGFFEKRLPVPMLNIINGGAHADNDIDIQEFMIIPRGFTCFSEALRASAEIYSTLKGLLSKSSLSVAVGDEGGFAPRLGAEEALEVIVKAIEVAGYIPGEQVFLGLDVASSEWYNGESGIYTMPKCGKSYTREELAKYLKGLCKKFPIISIEDGMAEDDYKGWEILGRTLGGGVLLVGDDLFVTSKERIAEGINKKIASAVLLKPNQIGTISEVKAAAATAARGGYRCIISHRSGDTADSAIADIGVALEVGMIKSGAPCRAERVEKYNRLLEIEREMLGNRQCKL